MNTQARTARPATYQDILDAPPHMVAELANGRLHLHLRCPVSAAGRPASPQQRVELCRAARAGDSTICRLPDRKGGQSLASAVGVGN